MASGDDRYAMMGISMTIFSRVADRLRRLLGLDRAIAYTVFARLVNILGSTGTVLLIVHFLSPVEQGYYYALLSLVSLQAIFELGFSFVVQQLAAHESAHLEFAREGGVTGSLVAHARLASIFQMMVRWYTRAALVMVLLLLPGGWFFFRRQVSYHVAWQLPWSLAAVACAAAFLLTPFYSFLDGCGQIREVATLRLREAIAAVLMAWSTMLLHKGLYSPAMVIVGQAAVGLSFVWGRRHLLYNLYRYPSHDHAVSWREEVLPFQWKIAVSWMCAYFTAQVFVPLLFSLRGAVEAGQMGMSLSITSYMSVLLLAWVSTKATPFGQMIARGDYLALEQLFVRSFRQSFSLLALLAVAAMAGICGIQYLFPRLAARLVAPAVFALLLLTMLSGYVVQSFAIYLRSFKREPFLGLYVSTAVLSVCLVLLTARRWGNMGVAVSYASCTGVVGLLSAIIAFRKHRRRIASEATLALQTEHAP
jgi:O-antigen/teichoic acid export membrane protein